LIEKNKDLSTFLKVYKTLGRLPTWSEYEHLGDTLQKSTSGVEIIETSGQVLCDITQFLKQTKLTGIQRVVKSFQDLDIPSFQLVYFDDGNYYTFNEGALGDKSTFLRIRRETMYFVKVHTLRLGFSIWTKYLSKMINRLGPNYSTYVSLLKNFRNRLLPERIPSNKVEIQDLLGARLFIPDLPSERNHLESLLVLSKKRVILIDIFLHDAIPLTFPELMPVNSTNEFNLYLKVVAHSNRVFCSTTTVKRDIEKVLPLFLEDTNSWPSLELHPFPFAKTEKSGLQLNKKEMKILMEITSNEKPFVFAVGTILTRKNYALIKRSIDHLSQKDFDCRFIIFAHHNWGDKSFSLSMESGRDDLITVLSGCSDALIHEVSKHAIAMVYPSLVEGFGLPISEAIASGVRVIVNDIEPMSFFAEKSNLVYLARANSSEDWAGVISDLCKAQHAIEIPTNDYHESWESWAKNFVLGNLIKNSMN
jgi:glycosyltransferase involved in cell wall biosynthesis